MVESSKHISVVPVIKTNNVHEESQNSQKVQQKKTQQHLLRTANIRMKKIANNTSFSSNYFEMKLKKTSSDFNINNIKCRNRIFPPANCKNPSRNKTTGKRIRQPLTKTSTVSPIMQILCGLKGTTIKYAQQCHSSQTSPRTNFPNTQSDHTESTASYASYGVNDPFSTVDLFFSLDAASTSSSTTDCSTFFLQQWQNLDDAILSDKAPFLK